MQAQYNLGCCYANGDGVAKDPQQAVYWYRESAEQGYASAQYNLGVCYEYGNGVDEDLKQAEQWYLKATTQEHKNSQVALERLRLKNSISIVYDYNQAVDAYKRGDYNLAYPVFKRLAEGGDKNAQCYVGSCYQLGRGVSKSDRQAFNWYTKAAEKGSAAALYNLATYYERGVCVIKEEKKAFDLYYRAATLGHADAQYVLGLLYMCDIGVKVKDKDKRSKAVQWFQKAAKQGHPKAIETLKDVSYVTKPFILYMVHLHGRRVYSEPSGD